MQPLDATSEPVLGRGVSASTHAHTRMFLYTEQNELMHPIDKNELTPTDY